MNSFTISENSFLTAVRKIPGKTESKKMEYLHRLAKEIALDCKDSKNLVSERVEEALVPLLSLFVAKIKKDHEGIFKALTSGNSMLFDCALKTDWFFIDNKSPEFYNDRIFPLISLVQRKKIFKKLSIIFTRVDKKSADKFHAFFYNIYPIRQTVFLLISCSSEYVIKLLKKNFFRIPDYVLEKMTVTSPDAVVEYIKLGRNLKRYEIANIFRKVLTRDITFFPQLEQCFDSIGTLQFSKKLSKKLLEKYTDLIINSNRDVLFCFDLSLLTRFLLNKNRFSTNEQLINVFAKFMPSTKFGQYDFTRFWKKLKYIEDQKMETFRAIYNKAYGNDISNSEVYYTFEFAVHCDKEERIKIARIQIEKSDWNSGISNYPDKWLPLLPLSESIPIISEGLNRVQKTEERYGFLRSMLKCCLYNEDYMELEKVSELIRFRYKNDNSFLIYNLLYYIFDKFVLIKITSKALDNMNEIIKNLYVKDGFEISYNEKLAFDRVISGLYDTESYSLAHFFRKVLYCNLKLNKTITDIIAIYCNLLIKEKSVYWKVDNEYSYECFKEIWKFIQNEQLIRPDFVKQYQQTIVIGLLTYVKSMKGDYSILNQEWFLNAVKEVQRTCNITEHYKSFFQAYLPELIKNKKEKINFKHYGEKTILKKNIDRVKDRFDEYIAELLSSVVLKTNSKKFIRSCVWYDEISGLLIRALINNVFNETSGDAFYALALILDKESLEKLILMNLPEDKKKSDSVKLNDSLQKRKDNLEFYMKALQGIRSCLEIPNLKIILRLCNGDYFNILFSKITSISTVARVLTVKEFCFSYQSKALSINKQKMTMIGLVSSNTEIFESFIKIRKNESNLSIRSFIFQKILKRFYDNPANSFDFLCECIRDFNEKDVDWPLLLEPKKIISEFNNRFIREVLQVIRKTYAQNPKLEEEHLYTFLKYIELSKTELEEDLHILIVKYYFENRKCAKSHLLKNYVIDGYLASNGGNFNTKLDNVIQMIKNLEGKDPETSKDNDILVLYIESTLFYKNLLDCNRKKALYDELVKLYFRLYPKIEYPSKAIIYSLYSVSVSNNLVESAINNIKYNLPELLELYGSFAIPKIVSQYKNKLFSWLMLEDKTSLNQSKEICKKLFDETEEIYQLFGIILIELILSKIEDEDIKEGIVRLTKSRNPTIRLYAYLCLEKN